VAVIQNRAEQYISGVLDGSIITSKLVRLACERHRRDLQDGHLRNLKFSPKHVGSLGSIGAITEGVDINADGTSVTVSGQSRGQIVDAVSIRERPAEICGKNALGDPPVTVDQTLPAVGLAAQSKSLLPCATAGEPERMAA
jgi:hypothetical protein